MAIKRVFGEFNSLINYISEDCGNLKVNWPKKFTFKDQYSKREYEFKIEYIGNEEHLATILVDGIKIIEVKFDHEKKDNCKLSLFLGCSPSSFSQVEDIMKDYLSCYCTEFEK